MSSVDFFGFVSSKYDPSQTGYNFIPLPYKDTIFYISSHPFVFTCEDYIFNSDRELMDYFNTNPSKKVNGTIAVVKNTFEKFYECINGKFIDNTGEIKSRIRSSKQIEFFTEAVDLNCYLNDDRQSLLYAPRNSYTGISSLIVDKVKFINNVGDKYAFRALLL